MTLREYPRHEWARLAHTEIGPALGLLPAETRMLVVEAGDAIVGAWAVMRYVHVEGIWIAPEHRKRGRVFAYLLRGMAAIARSWGVNVVLTAAETDEVRVLIGRLGGQLLPGDHFVLPIGGL